MFGITRRPAGDPMLDLLYQLERRMGRIMPEPFAAFDWQPAEVTAAWMPPVDIVEEPEAIRIVAELPGVKPGAVKISVEGNVLTLRGTKEHLAEEQLDKVHRYERSYGSFERSFTLPASVDWGGITATYDLGMVTLTLPKAEKAKPREIKVEVPLKVKG